MARSRNIKPGFFANENLADCDPMARLLFISMWMLADREGRLENRPKKIKVQTFPYEDCDIDELISQLVKFEFIFIYKASGKQIIQINNWSKHQNPHHKEVVSEFPRFEKINHELITVQACVNHDSNTVCDSYKPVSNTIRDRIYLRDGRFCAYCKNIHDLQIDHILPVSKGGNSEDYNLQVLCASCNVLKGNNIVDHDSCLNQGKVVIDLKRNQPLVNHSASCPTDSLNPLPETPILKPETPLPNKPAQAPVDAKVKTPDYPEWFEGIWKHYPTRAGGDNKKIAFQKAGARVKDGVSHSDLFNAVDRYKYFVVATGKVSTEYVKQAATFFGSLDNIKNQWIVPAAPNGAAQFQRKEKFNPNAFIAEQIAKNSVLERSGDIDQSTVLEGELSDEQSNRMD